jgi:predicted metal-dependent hydrolase
MQSKITVGGVTVDVVHKDIKNVHLSVHPPTGRVTIAAPTHMSLDTVRLFAIAKVSWIRQQQDKLNQQDRETPREFLSRESHYVWGERYLMKVVEVDAPPAIELKHTRMVFQIRPEMDNDKKKELLDGWYRELVREAIEPLLATWEQRICLVHAKDSFGSTQGRHMHSSGDF